MGLSLYERETHISFNEEEELATIETFSPSMKRKLDKVFGTNHADANGKYDDCNGARWEVEKSQISFRRKRELTPEQRERARQTAINNFHSNKE